MGRLEKINEHSHAPKQFAGSPVATLYKKDHIFLLIAHTFIRLWRLSELSLNRFATSLNSVVSDLSETMKSEFPCMGNHSTGRCTKIQFGTVNLNQ